MVEFTTVDAANANVTGPAIAQKLSLTDGPFGLQELQSTFSFPPRNGMSWTISIRTSDLVAVVFIICILTFAIDHYLFKSRYLVHIGGATRAKDSAAILNEKASLHEKEALMVESGLKGIHEKKDSYLKPKSEQGSETPPSTTFSRWTHKAICILLILFVVAVSDGKVGNRNLLEERSESPREKAEAEREVEKSSLTSRWGKMFWHPRVQATSSSALFSFTVLFMLAAVAFHVIFCPMVLTLIILHQCLFYEQLNPGATVPWKSIAISSTLHLVIWTIICVGLLLKPNRVQGMLWKCIKWTHAVNWWFFWGIFEMSQFYRVATEWIGLPSIGITTELVLFILRPTLVAYLYSGTVRDTLIAVRLCKFFWNHDTTKL